MNLVRNIVLVVALMLAMCGIARACDGYQDISTDDLKTYRDKLGQADADPLDKFFAFQQLYCSSSPVIRAYAAKYGLQANSDPLVRQQIMLTLLLDMKHLTVQLAASDQTSADDKAFIKQQDGRIDYVIEYASESDGCVSWYYNDHCDERNSVFIKGDKVEVYDGNNYGTLMLTDGNDLSGYLRRGVGDHYGRILATIALN